MTKSLPYETATSGKNAINDMQKIMKAFGATSFGCAEDFAKGEVAVHFEVSGRRVVVRASSRGYAAAWLKAHPWSHRMRLSQRDYQSKALAQGQLAVYSILRDWIKGPVTAIEVGMLSFDAAFLGQILLPDGRSVMDHVEGQRLLQIEAQA